MHAFLYIGSTEKFRTEAMQHQLADWNIDPIDMVTITAEAQHISIADIRVFTRRLLLAPVKSPYVAGMISGAQSMTPEAQNALLKTLEEPPPRVRMLLESESEHLLLPTIVSRCSIVRLSAEGQDAHPKSTAALALTQLMDQRVGERMLHLEPLAADAQKAKLTILEATREWMRLLHNHYSGTEPRKDAKILVALLRRLMRAQTHLALNCNPRLILDRVFL